MSEQPYKQSLYKSFRRHILEWIYNRLAARIFDLLRDKIIYMNDFTKEELGIIYCNLCINPKTKDILIKLQSMIENYCDHEGFYKFNYGEHTINYCDKCKCTFK